jgi:DNA-binding transcriptional MerR regulator
MEQDVFTLSELTDLAGVSTRTVRYYIAEGLLPPPEGAGPRTTYSRQHLNRLLLIGRLKGAYLPLKEIRRRLDAMTDDEVEAALAEVAAEGETTSGPLPLDDAGTYLRRALASPRVREPADRRAYDIRFPGEPRERRDDRRPERDRRYRREASSIDEIDGVAWRHIELGPDATLLIREEALERKRERVEWLIAWAKRVFS